MNDPPIKKSSSLTGKKTTYLNLQLNYNTPTFEN